MSLIDSTQIGGAPSTADARQAQRRGQSPLGFLRALSARIRSAVGGDLTTDLMDEGLADLDAGLAQAAASSASTETLLQTYLRHMSEAWADGVLTVKEKAMLGIDLLRVKRSAGATTRHIKALR
jgi:hypothetical protein